MPKKKRLDQLLVERGLATTPAHAQACIMAGEIFVNGTVSQKAGTPTAEDAVIEFVSNQPKYVSRGGEKLFGALTDLQCTVRDLVCLDVGASTGGFTDCLLQEGAAFVYTVDVGKGQLDPKIRNHPQVNPRESFHARLLEKNLFDRELDLAVVDVSFISLKKILPFVVPCLKKNAIVLAMIKPQFEAEKKDAPQGVVKNEQVRKKILHDLSEFAGSELGLVDLRLSDAVIQGPKGNQETFLYGRTI